MNNYRNTDYALNKHSKGIVYKFADGIIETTLTDYLRENPEKTEEDFNRIKKLSDEIKTMVAFRISINSNNNAREITMLFSYG